MQWQSTSLVSVGMVALGTGQAVYAVTQRDSVLTGLGLLYGTLGGVMLWKDRTTN